MKIRKARITEAEVYYSFINDAREYHAKLGFTQWHWKDVTYIMREAYFLRILFF